MEGENIKGFILVKESFAALTLRSISEKLL